MTPKPLADLTLLRSFLVIARSPSVSAAGSALGLSQPAITQQLQRLEAQLGQRLVHRRSRPLTLTPAGQALAQELPALIEQIEALTERVRSMTGLRRQILRMAMPDSLSCILGAEFISASRTLATSVELRSGISPWIEEAFRARHVDLAVDSPPLDPMTKADHLPLFRDPYVIVSPRRMQGLPPADFVAAHHQVAYGRTSKFGATTAAIAQEFGAVTRPQFSFDSTQSLMRFVQAGYGWAVTSALCLLQLPTALRDIDIHLCRENHARNFMLIYRRGETEDLAGEAADRLVGVFRRLVEGPWDKIAPVASALIRETNPDHFPAAITSIRHATGEDRAVVPCDLDHLARRTGADRKVPVILVR